MVWFCYQCYRFVNAVTRNVTCGICHSEFVDDIDTGVAMPYYWHERMMQRYPTRQVQQAPQVPNQDTNPFGRPGPMRIPLPPTQPAANQGPPANRRSTQRRRTYRGENMYVTPDGLIVRPNPRVPSEAEVTRRRQALDIKELTAEQAEELCSICLDESCATAAFLPCNHYFHQACMERWLEQKNACPLCQQIVAP